MKLVYLSLVAICLAHTQSFLQADSDESFETEAELDPVLFLDIAENEITLEMANEPSTPDNDPFLIAMLSEANEIFYDDVLEEAEATNQ